MKAIRATGLALLALLVAAPAFADGREGRRDRGRGDDRGTHWVFPDRDHRGWSREHRRDRDRARYREHRRFWQHGFRGRDWRPDRGERRRHHRRWSHRRHHDRPDVVIISPFGGIFRLFD